MPEVVMPRLSDSMEEGTLVRWLKADGEPVARGEEIVEIETDKATLAYEADADGVLHHAASEGDALPVGAVIATIGDTASATAATAPTVVTLPVAGPTSPARSAASATPADASPVARRVAEQLGVALAQIAGSGPNGRILKADVVAHANGAGAVAEPPARAAADAAMQQEQLPARPAAEGARGASEALPLTRVQQTIARRMAESKATVPDFALTVDVDMEAASELREQLRGQADPLPSLNDLIVRAAALALRAHPRVNGAYRGDAFELWERVNVGIAVAGEDALLVPTVFDADCASLAEIACTTRALAEAARTGSLTPAQLAGGTFTISNLGMFGIDRFSGVVNAPQAAILCVGAAKRRVVVTESGDFAARRVASLTLVSDHRILYGADAAAFLQTLQRLLEQPLQLLL